MKTHWSASTCGGERHTPPGVSLSGAVVAVVLSLALASPVPAAAQEAGELMERATADFMTGRIADALRSFDRVVQLVPGAAPQLWQRGIALYYAERFDDCRAQFELHRTVNPDDVENAAWHFLCVARLKGVAAARQALLPVGPDPRVPMREVYRMFRGEIEPSSVLVAAGRDPSARFYAALYVGLYLEALGEARAGFYIEQASADEFAVVGGYMYRVANVHMQLRGWTRRQAVN